jgi:hypothetical protein
MSTPTSEPLGPAEEPRPETALVPATGAPPPVVATTADTRGSPSGTAVQQAAPAAASRLVVKTMAGLFGLLGGMPTWYRGAWLFVMPLALLGTVGIVAVSMGGKAAVVASALYPVKKLWERVSKWLGS